MQKIISIRAVSKEEARAKTINSISQRYKELRQDSKPITFLL